LPIDGVDAENIADGEIMVAVLDDPNLIARPHIALHKDAQIGPPPP
jgi:arsenate reductase-like glutaredoxin family protein